MDNELMKLALLSSQEDMMEAAKYISTITLISWDPWFG